jgi:NADPH-dependent glutamate synthase beta subunit-like oxidoreductase/NAD-dependent dihydropyrimidine dehydrogenase PreA subunit
MNNQAYMVPNPATPCQPIRIDPELCISCYRCADQCRVDIMVRNGPKTGGISPCEVSCPAGENIRWTTYYIEKGRFADALESIKTENPFPGICGRVCFHPCEEKCARIDLDAGVATNALERAAFDYAGREEVKRPEKRPATGKKVAVVGGGPAGLTCAYYLAVLGHNVTVYEAQPVAGGIPRLNIPEFRLPGAVVEQEVKEVASLGVDIRVNSPVDSKTFTKLMQEYDACFVATGAPVSQKLRVPGEESTGVISALEFLRKVRLGGNVAIGKRVVVIGGGNVATDSARLACRLGAEEVTMVCLESRDIMPAYKTEVEAAEAEGISVVPSWGVQKIESNGKKILGVVLKSCTSVYDKENRFSPVYDENLTRKLEADTIIVAIGQTTDLSFADADIKAGTRIKVDPDTLATDISGVFAGGDVGSTICSIVQAIASGKRAAISIDIYLRGGDKQILAATANNAVSMGTYLKRCGVNPENRVPEEPENAYYGPGSRQEPVVLPAEQRTVSQDEVNKGLPRELAVSEAKRCFRCSQYEPPVVLYPDECWFCGTCVEECPVKGAIRMEHPLNQRVGWKRKETGELFRVGMKNPPPPNNRPPVG